MRTEIEVFGERAIIEDGVWSCDDGLLLGTIRKLSREPLDGYRPDDDLATAEHVVRKLKGRIVAYEAPPEETEVRVY